MPAVSGRAINRGFSRIEIGRIQRLVGEKRDSLAQGVSISGDDLIAGLLDGRTITVPLTWFPRLAHGTAEERAHWRVIAGGKGIHWPSLDEDISVASLLAGRKSGETQEFPRAAAKGPEILTRGPGPSPILFT